MTARSFAEIYKDATASSVHVTTALGNAAARRRFRPFIKPKMLDQAKRSDWSTPLIVTKADPDKQMVFGWASVVEKDGVAIIDKQGDVIPVPELEAAAYDFVLNSRVQGDMHVSKGVGRLVESMVFTREKQALLKIDLGMVGWWTGFRVDDPGLWAACRAGERPEFSIGGAAVPVEG
ncbi:MAG: hypothetical protein KGL35_27045 [Bradyrhizobium sp.]|nr:hypothetical protein [Bradyrhizobium sp.]